MIAQTLRGPHNLYRRYQALLESTLSSMGLAVVAFLALNAIPVYPPNWVWVIVGAIALAGIRWPAAAYVLTVGVMVYPVYTINLYLAVLFLTVSLLGVRVFSHYLGAVALVCATPALAQYHLHWLSPILGGLWWGPIGVVIGGTAALWGKLLGGMAGLNPDWLTLAGQMPEAQVIITRFQDANSLDTLLLLIEPFADTPDVMLYNLLQVAGWSVAGGFVGSLANRRWVKYRTPWSILVVTAGGGVIMLATHLGLPLWLHDTLTEGAQLALQDRTSPLFSLLIVIIVGTTVFSVRESLDLPVAPKRSIYAAGRSYRTGEPQFARLFKRRPAQPVTVRNRLGYGLQGQSQSYAHQSEQPYQQVPVPPFDNLPEWEPPQDDSGLIMLEID
jgi:hypothetical protein